MDISHFCDVVVPHSCYVNMAHFDHIPLIINQPARLAAYQSDAQLPIVQNNTYTLLPHLKLTQWPITL